MKPGFPPAPTFEFVDDCLSKTYFLSKEHLGKIDQEVENEIRQVEQYVAPVRSALPLFNKMLLEVAT